MGGASRITGGGSAGSEVEPQESKRSQQEQIVAVRIGMHSPVTGGLSRSPLVPSVLSGQTVEDVASDSLDDPITRCQSVRPVGTPGGDHGTAATVDAQHSGALAFDEVLRDILPGR